MLIQRLTDWFANLRRHPPLAIRYVEPGLVPEGTLYHGRSSRWASDVFLVESLPQRRVISSFNPNGSFDYYYLYFPYTYFAVRYYPVGVGGSVFHNLHVMFSPTPLLSLRQNVYWLPLGNIYPDMGVCLGDNVVGLDHNIKPCDLAKSIIRLFWGTAFEGQSGHFAHHTARWQELTKSGADERFINEFLTSRLPAYAAAGIYYREKLHRFTSSDRLAKIEQNS